MGWGGVMYGLGAALVVGAWVGCGDDEVLVWCAVVGVDGCCCGECGGVFVGAGGAGDGVAVLVDSCVGVPVGVDVVGAVVVGSVEWV